MKRYAVIMAGGGGTRLWPLSTRQQPKHLLRLTGDDTMFERSVRRLFPLFPPEHILVVTVQAQAEQLKRLVPELPAENFLIEPEPKGTASVVGLGAVAIEARGEAAVMVVLTSDHLIGNEAEFLKVLDAGCQVAEQGGLLTLGIRPSFPSTGYGYIEAGEAAPIGKSLPVKRAVCFKEKPARKQAEEFVASGTHLWNSGMFLWRTDRILGEFERHMPDLFSTLQAIRSSWRKEGADPDFPALWARIKAETIDYGIMEKADDIYVLPVDDLEWNDVGSWLSLFDFLPNDSAGNVRLAENLIDLETRGSLVVEGSPRKLVATIGLEDIVIVDTDKALLVCRREDVQQVREVVAQLKASGREDYT